MAGQAQLQERLLSHLRASCSGSSHKERVHVPRRRRSVAGSRYTRRTLLRSPPLLRLVARRALQQADYSFYQRLRPEDVSEQYLWDQRLLPLLGYLTAEQTVKVREALSLAYDAHSGQRRKSGEPFITHPVEVTRILAELKMDFECLVAGLLHDTVEDCGDSVGLDEIEFHFGRNVRRIVEGETKFCKLPSHLNGSGSLGGSSDSEDSAPPPGGLPGSVPGPLPPPPATTDLARNGGAALEGAGGGIGGASAARTVGAGMPGADSSGGPGGGSLGGGPANGSASASNGTRPSRTGGTPEASREVREGGADGAAQRSKEWLEGLGAAAAVAGEGPPLPAAAGAGYGGWEEGVPPPRPSTFSTSDSSGREPLMDLVLRTPGNDTRARDIQFLFLAMTEEWRIIVVKLADRLHNMRTMGSMPQGKARKIATETLEVFGPLARLLGLYSIKEELEELAFKYANPPAYDSTRREVRKLWEVQRPVVEAACVELNDRLTHDAYLRERAACVRVEPMRKALYSSWKKLSDAGKLVKDVRDIAQLRVVIEPVKREGVVSLDYCSEKQLCYHVMGLVHSFWAPIPGSMKDYIATPKPNNYQSLHTTVIPTGIPLDQLSIGRRAPSMFPIEIQIRTETMNRVAELGIAVDTWAPPAADGSLDEQLHPPDGQQYWQYNGAGRGANGAPTTGGSNGRSGAAPQQGQQASGKGGAQLADAAPQREEQQRRRQLQQQQQQPSLFASFWQWASGSDSDEGSASPALRPLPGQSAAQALASQGGSGEAPAETPKPASQQRQQGGAEGPVGPGAVPAGPGLNGGGAVPGAAAKGSLQRLDPTAMTRRINWLNSIRQWQEEFVGTLTAHEFIQCVTDDILGQGVFVFTPGGQIIRLPKGSTVVDFAYHIHTQIGNTMAAAKVNSKLVPPGYELQNADVVEVVQYRGPVNATILRKHQQWYDLARTKTARHKIARFIRENSALAASKGIKTPAPPVASDDDAVAAAGGAGAGGWPQLGSSLPQLMWLVIQCEDRQGILADVAQILAEHQFDIKSYSGSSDLDAASGVLNFSFTGGPANLEAMCHSLDATEGLRHWALGCELPEAVVDLKRHI